MSVRITRLAELNLDELRALISGYRSDQRYRVEKRESAERTEIALALEDLPEPYIKVFGEDEGLETLYPGFIAQGYSWGAWVEGRLAGVAICEKRAWNNTLWLWELHVQNGLRGQGIGSSLLKAVQKQAVAENFRILALEVQNTNVPAIRFYRKHGFEIDGLDLSQYTNEDVISGEVAIFMKWKLHDS